MDDQLVRLPPGLRGVAWNSFQSATQAHEIMRRLRSGDVKVLFVSPERVLSSGFQRFLLSLDGGVSLACVDEAHCVSEWSHNFRPSFLGLGRVLCDVLRVPLVLALTATATLDTAASVCRVLRIPLANIVRNAPLRDNLRTHVERVVEPEARRRRLLELLQRDELRGKPALVYVLRRKDADETAFWLRERGLNADSYHSGKTTRRQVQQRFLTGAVSVLVATVAFGMGIDKPDIRGVFHLSLPRSLEEYVQQVGRAGRDGAEAWCTAFFGEEDVTLLKSLLHAEVVERPVAKKLFSALLLGQDGAKEDGACGHNNRTRFTTFLLADAQAEFGLSPEVALTLVCNLPRTARGTQIEFVGRQHAHALVRFHKTHPEELARSVPIVAGVLQTAQCSAGGSYKVNLATVANAVGCDVSDAQASLLRLKATREVSLEWRDQALIFEKGSGSVELDVDELTDAALGRIAAYQQLQSLKVDIVHAAFACAAAGAAHEQQKDRDEPGPRGVLAAVCDEYFASALETSGRHFLLELQSRAGSSAQLRDWRCDPRSKHLQSEIASLVRQHEYQVSPTWVAKFMHGLLHDAARAEAGRHASFGRYAFVPFEELQSLARQVIQCVLADN
jgi:ATP-dependent DNA helicase Q4